MAQSFWSDASGKKITIGNLTSVLPINYSSSNAVIKINGSTTYFQDNYSLSNGSAPSAPLTFSAPSASSQEVTVSVYATNANGQKTNTVYDTITIKNALSQLNVTSPVTSIYTGETATLTVSAANANVYGWSNSANFEVSTSKSATITTTRTANANTISCKAIDDISNTSVTSEDVTITVKTNADVYSTNQKTASIKLTVKQKVNSILTSSQSVYVGDTISLSYSLSPSNAYNKGVSVSANDTSYFVGNISVSSGKIGATTAKAGVAVLTLKSADGKATATSTITINNKGTASISASPASVQMNTGGEATVTLTPTGCTLGTPASTSSAIATVTKSGNNLTITGVKAGSTTVTCGGTVQTGYSGSPSTSIGVIVKDITMTIS